MLERIIGNIYLSSLELLEQADLDSIGITHILSILPGPLPRKTKKYTHLQISINDTIDSNILSVLPDAFAFINSCLYGTPVWSDIVARSPQKGTILIHCHEGLSRSPAVLICYLMRLYQLTLVQATHAVKRKIGTLSINSAFEQQLQVFEQCKGDLNSEIYKQYLVSFTGDAKKAYEQFEKETNPDSIEKQEDSMDNGILRCKICREALAKSTQMLSHVKPEESSKQSVFNKKMGNYIYSSTKASVDCSHYFLKDPLKWMEVPSEELEGKLNCIKCHSKLGGYSWKGSRCSCGAWIVPSFHLQTSKVDYVKYNN